MGKFIPGWQAAALVAAWGLAGCLGENPVKPSVPTAADTLAMAQRTLDSAQTLVNQKKFAEAMACYERAIALDSNLSQAYLGYATAVVFYYDIDVGEILEDLEAFGQGNTHEFLNHPDTLLTARLQAASRINRVLDVLVNRDTLSTAAKPLTDGKVTYKAIGLQFAVYKLLYFMTRVHDRDRNDTLDFRDRPYFNVGPGSWNLDSLSQQMKTDTLLQSAINQKILELQNGLTDLTSLLSQIHLDTAGAPSQVKSQIDSAIGYLGETMPFYQFGDRKDNDGDGCIDEEFIDSLDNDLDGFVDEDARLLSGNGLFGGTGTGPADEVDNDHNGSKDAGDAGENLAGTLVSPQRPYLLTFVALSGQAENWVKIKKGAANMDVRLSIQKDSLSLPSRAALPNYAAKLEAAKTQMGGCWRNYP